MMKPTFLSALIWGTVLCTLFTVLEIVLSKAGISNLYSPQDFKLWMYDSVVVIGWIVWFLRKRKDGN